ncbi:MAG: methylated-DNA--[protein]-cysteine S-methyltransferase [Alphaproteobacteria bacterium]|nr:methylated-DNA--[protein]-cysteine S-methyltransferase [Alphaproteobacteria bacterium]
METAARARLETSLMQDICRYIESHSGENLSLALLAKQAQLSPAHFQRRFKAAIGVTPKHYAEACRLRKLKHGLRQQPSVTAAIYDAGFSSPSRVYERVETRLGMTPKQYRGSGKGVAISYAAADTPLGPILLGATDRGLCFLQFREPLQEEAEQLRREYPQATFAPMDTAHREQFGAWMQALSQYLSGHVAMPDLPLDIRGTVFQLKVWNYLQTIPSGSVESYAHVAAAIGQPEAARAVANACARNRIAIVIPCHRVIRGNGALAGYRWGVERKRTLLALEQAAASLRNMV